MAHTYRHPRAALTVDAVVFSLGHDDLEVALVKRKSPPFAGRWALPGGFVEVEEALEAAARRELYEETGIQRVSLTQLHTFGAVNRDPRERIVTVAYFGCVQPSRRAMRAASDAAEVCWCSATRPPRLAFDHRKILNAARERLRGEAGRTSAGFDLLEPRFTLPELHNAYEKILGQRLDRRNFCKKLLSSELLVELNDRRQARVGRPARVYRFDRARYRELRALGFRFEL